MALYFNNADTDRVVCGSNAVIDNVNTGSLVIWFNANTIDAAARLMNKGASGAFHRLSSFGAGAGRWFWQMERATTNLDFGVDVANLPNVGANKWSCIACVWDSGGVDGDQRMYGGDLDNPLTEATTYFRQRVGSGAVGDDSGSNLHIGNDEGVVDSFDGDIAILHYFNAHLTIGQLIDQQWHPHKISSTVGLWNLNGTGTQADLSGNGNNGTVTGATHVAHVPLRAFFGYTQAFIGAISAAQSALLAMVNAYHSQRP